MKDRRRKGPSPEMLELEASLQDTRVRIAQAYAGFNSASDSELVESYVYEIQSLQARYSYLLRQRKALEPQADRDPSGARAAEPAPAPLPVA